MQDAYVGDIGDYGKYGLLRVVENARLSVSINWYYVKLSRFGKQDDGKYVNYLFSPSYYRKFDPVLFDVLHQIVTQNNRTIDAIERSCILNATYFQEPVIANRTIWHENALKMTKGKDVIFLDPDNGLETENMFLTGKATEKHVKWNEIKSYYDRGQTVVMYQHRPKIETKEKCVNRLVDFGKSFLNAGKIFILEFPKFTNRYYVFYTQPKHQNTIEEVCKWMATHWNGMCESVGVCST